MVRVRLAIFSACLLGTLPTLALADPTVVSTPSSGTALTTVNTVRVTPQASSVVIVERSVVAPKVLVPRDLAQQPVYSGLIEVRAGTATMLIDPYRSYRRAELNAGPDANHSIMKAQRLYRCTTGDSHARIVYGTPQTTKPADVDVTPAFIIPKPNLNAPQPQDDAQPQPRKVNYPVAHRH